MHSCFRSAALIGAIALLATSLSGCGKSQATTVAGRRPASVLAMATAPVTPARGPFVEQWDQLLQEKPKPVFVPATTTLPDPQSMSKQAQVDFIAHSPIFQHRIDGRSFDVAIQSINDITAELPVDVAKGFQVAVRFLMVTNLPIEKARQEKRDLSDDEIHSTVLQAVANKTPWEILVAAKEKRAELVAQTVSDPAGSVNQ
jgi:hypothetical protein